MERIIQYQIDTRCTVASVENNNYCELNSVPALIGEILGWKFTIVIFWIARTRGFSHTKNCRLLFLVSTSEKWTNTSRVVRMCMCMRCACVCVTVEIETQTHGHLNVVDVDKHIENICVWCVCRCYLSHWINSEKKFIQMNRHKLIEPLPREFS